jgi:D-alanine-D-alanine ligase-like ATP-grasp enzyme
MNLSFAHTFNVASTHFSDQRIILYANKNLTKNKNVQDFETKMFANVEALQVQAFEKMPMFYVFEEFV